MTAASCKKKIDSGYGNALRKTLITLVRLACGSRFTNGSAAFMMLLHLDILSYMYILKWFKSVR